MNYDEFKQVFLEVLRESRLPTIGPPPNEEVLDLSSMDRTFAVLVEPMVRATGRAFQVTGRVSFVWTALHEARTRTSEDEVRLALLGEDGLDHATVPPLLRVELSIQAAFEPGEDIPWPSTTAWTKWSREARERLARMERRLEEGEAGDLVFLSWQRDPEMRGTCNADGELRLESVRIGAFKAIDLPRVWDLSSHEEDEPPHAELRGMFELLKGALQVLDGVVNHLQAPLRSS